MCRIFISFVDLLTISISSQSYIFFLQFDYVSCGGRCVCFMKVGSLFFFVFCFLFLYQMLHESIHDEVLGRLKQAYSQVRIGDPLESKFKFCEACFCFCL